MTPRRQAGGNAGIHFTYSGLPTTQPRKVPLECEMELPGNISTCRFLALPCVIENENGLEVRLHVHTDFFAKDIFLEINASVAQWSDNCFDPDADASKKDSGR